MILQKPNRLAGHERFELILLGHLGRAAHGHRSFPIVLLARAIPWVAGVKPEVVDLRQTGTGITAAQLIGVELRLGTEILPSIVTVHPVLEAMGLRVHEMNLADQGGDVSGAIEMMRDGLVFKRPRHGVVVSPVIMRVESVSNEARDGTLTGFEQYALSNRTAERRKASRFGVSATGSPSIPSA
jgi:hypothetical protein